MNSGFRSTARAAWRGMTTLSLVLGSAAGFLVTPAQAASVSGATFSSTDTSRTASVGTKLYARQGAALTLSVATDAGTQCLRVTDGTNSVDYAQSTGRSSWSLTSSSSFTNTSSSGAAAALLTSGSGDGARSVTVTAFANANAQGKCTANKGEAFGTQTATYVADNTGPTLTPAFNPAPANGWGNTATTVTWTASDPAADLNNAGSGVAAQPTASTTYSTSGIYALTPPAVTDRVGNPGTGSGTLQLDVDAPTITGSRTPVANGFGWNNSPVTVSFACSDNPATNGSGLASPGCPGSTKVSTDGTNQSVTGSVSDVAGNKASATVDNINIDTVAPTLSGAATTSPNTNGWYKTPVSIHWSASDDRSGVDPATAPGDSVISSEGSGLTASASVADKAGNIGTAVSPKVNIDMTPPVTAISGPSNTWTNGAVTVTLSPTDNGSGPASTSYTVDGGAPQSGTSFSLSTEGDHVITYWSTDKAGNVETAKTAHVKIDKTAPTISHTFDPTDYKDGSWTNAAKVTVTFACADSLSGVASCTSPVDVTAEGAGQQVAGTAVDNAGNSSSDTATVNIDRTPPSVSATADRAANGNGWYNADVKVTYTCTDQASLSGVKSCPATQTFAEGKNQTASGTATDNAGNTATASLPGINVDETAPSLSGAATTAPNGHGWYDNSVVVKWTCSDALAGIDGSCPANSTLSGEGTNLGASATVYDLAGNPTTASVSGIRIDTTAPQTTATLSTPLSTGWYAQSAHVTLTGKDNLSGVDTTYYRVDGGAPKAYTGAFDFATAGVHTLTFWSVDNAGNAEDASGPGQTVTVKVDNIPPTIIGSASPAANTAGWNTSPVTVHFDCTDAESGIASCTKDTLLSTDGAGQSVTGTATDNGTNSANTTVSGINVDTTPPTLSGAATTPPNANGWYNGDVTVHWTAGDATSGLAGTPPADSVVTGQGADLTAGPVTVSDVAGNSTTQSVSGIQIDRTAPSITGKATTSPNSNGWYAGDVTVAWACDDALSGIADGDCPAPSTVTGEGSNLSATASVSDLAGNPASATVAGIKVDRTAPETTISAPSGWTNQDATVTLSATDNLSGVDATHYTVNGGAVQTGTSVTFSAEGVYDLEVWSVDKAGNAETPKTAVVQIDKTAPTITHTQSPAANADGWNNTDVTITFTCNDTGGSGVASCTGPITETHEGKAQPEPGTAMDNAGNSAIDPATVSIDKTPPTVSGAPDRAPNLNGWYNADVTVTFTCGDQAGLSGVKTCASPVTLKEGANQSARGTATDAAGNTASTSFDHVNVDKTAPTLSGTATAPPTGNNGWYTGDVTIAWSCSDTLSGIDGGCPANSTITGEGANLGASASVTDKAGNTTGASVSGIQIDRTPPTTTASLPPADSSNGWYKAGPTVTLTATDVTSGVAATYYRVDGGAAQAYTGPFTEGLEGVHTVTFWSVDNAGNVEPTTGNSVTVRVDTTKPTISGSRLPAANANGWNNEPVQVSFTCNDSGSGIASCTDPVTVAQGAGPSVTGTAIDNVGNSDTATVAGINVDQTPPTLTGAATTKPNADGWYNGDVTVHWSCADALSGVDGSCPADSTVTGEGENLSAQAHVADKAGNDTSATVGGLNIDRTGPVTSVSAPSDWQTSGVTLDVTATDNLSGVKATYFTVDGGAVQAGNKIALSADGVYTLTFWSVDFAGNEGTHGTATVKIDQTAPTISHTLSPEPNTAGWDNADTTVHFLCSDATSGIKSCTADQVVTTEAAGQKVAGTAVDNAGNSSSDTATVNLDKTKPTISGAPDRPANANGWYNADVTAGFTCDDTLSGNASCTQPQTLSEGRDQSVTGTATDLAGNTASATVSGINVDKTPPTLSGQASATGWVNHDVTVHWTCADALSGIDGSCPADSTVTGAGSNLSATATVTDKAGNATTVTVSGIEIDRTKPVTTVDVPASPYGAWYAQPVAVTLNAADDASGVAATYYTVDGGSRATYGKPFTISGGVHTVSYWSVDNAGNVEAANSLTVQVDNLPPTITGAATTSPNANGWYNGPVTVHFDCHDGQTDVGNCTADTTLTTEGAGQYVTGTATDVAGNTATAKVGPINIDMTAPVFPAQTVGTSFVQGQTVTPPTCNATDALSGVASCTVVKSGSGFTNANGVGDFTYTFTATDKAGNVATTSVTQHVGYGWSGFLQPITNTAHDLTTASVFNAGSTVPVKFQLKNASGAVVQATYMPVWLQPVDLGTASTGGTAVTSTAPATVGGSFKWDATAKQYVFTWQTPRGGAGHYYRIGVQLDSGDSYSTLIVLK